MVGAGQPRTKDHLRAGGEQTALAPRGPHSRSGPALWRNLDVRDLAHGRWLRDAHSRGWRSLQRDFPFYGAVLLRLPPPSKATSATSGSSWANSSASRIKYGTGNGVQAAVPEPHAHRESISGNRLSSFPGRGASQSTAQRSDCRSSRGRPLKVGVHRRARGAGTRKGGRKVGGQNPAPAVARRQVGPEGGSGSQPGGGV